MIILKEKVGDNEVFNFANYSYDVKKADRVIKQGRQNYVIEDLELKDLKPLIGFINIDQRYAANLSDREMNEIGIAVDDEELGGVILIDGWHRAYLLMEMGEKYMRVYLIENQSIIDDIKN